MTHLPRPLLLLLLALGAYLWLRPTDPLDEYSPLPWPLRGARWDMDVDYVTVKGRVGQ